MAGERMSEQEAREKYPHGAARNDAEDGFEAWHPASRAYIDYHGESRLPALRRVGNYLPLDAPDTTCPDPRCRDGKIAVPRSTHYRDVPANQVIVKHRLCNGTGKVPADSILTRIREGRFP